MSDAVAALRNLALSRLAQDHPIHVVLDDALRDELTAARGSVDALQFRRDQMERAGDLTPATPTSLADESLAPAADIDRMLTAARQVVEAIEAEAAASGAVLVLHFRALPPAEYQAELDKADAATKDPAAFLAALGDALLPACYLHASTADGAPVDLTLADLLASTLNHADLSALRDHVVRINRSGQTVPFSRRNSGAPTAS